MCLTFRVICTAACRHKTPLISTVRVVPLHKQLELRFRAARESGKTLRLDQYFTSREETERPPIPEGAQRRAPQVCAALRAEEKRNTEVTGSI